MAQEPNADIDAVLAQEENGDAKENDENMIAIPTLDNTAMNPYLLYAKLEQINEDARASEEKNQNAKDLQIGPNLPPVRWFEKELRQLLCTAFTMLINNLRNALRNVLQKSVFENPPKLKNANLRKNSLQRTGREEEVCLVFSAFSSLLFSPLSLFSTFELILFFFRRRKRREW